MRLWDNQVDLDQEDANLLACFAASSVVRNASSKAFNKYGRSMQTSNVHEYLHESFTELLVTVYLEPVIFDIGCCSGI